jgi:rSAM/selenodomain-associated transferase 2/rSAM/selenodomain-associated transferase 1
MPGTETISLNLMVKAPEPERAKTRLAPALSSHGAAALARAFLRDALEEWQGVDVQCTLAKTGNFDDSLREELAGRPQRSQGEGELGQRLERVLSAALASHDVAIVVGTDIPGVGQRELFETQRLLETHDAVLGPAEDGGFYWLALRSCSPGLLSDIPWSDASTCLRTKERLERAGMRVAMLGTRFDVDTPADLTRLGAYLRSHPMSMPHTRKFLASSANGALSIIIPVLNEASKIESLLRSLTRDAPWAEVIVVDGGSEDETLAIASSFKGVSVVRSPPGRARQLNSGAAQAIGGTLLFMHADARLPREGLKQIQELMAKETHVAGAFRLRTRYDESGPRREWVRPFLRLADLRSRYSKSPYGDQGLFVRAREFHALGGYPDQPILEDLHLSRALSKRQSLAILPGPMTVSGRRFQQRPLYYFALMNSFPLLYRLGVSPRRLASLYRSKG